MAEESDAQKLNRLASKRVSNLLNSIKGIGNLGRYKPTAKQRDAVFAAIDAELKKANGRWSGQAAEVSGGFKLPT